MALIEVSNLTKIYQLDSSETRALAGVSFNIEKGEFVAIMGPSGSGKSTLLHILGFLEKQTAGVYKFQGKTYGDYAEDELAHLRNKKMGFVFQAFNLLARTTVFDNVKLPLIYSNIDDSSVDEITRNAIKNVGLEHRAGHESSQLSGGEKQRVAIARALVNNPEVIFADEPTGNLDSKSGGQIMNILRELNEKHGHTIILITHDRQMAEHARRVLFLRDGELIEDKKTEPPAPLSLRGAPTYVGATKQSQRL
ncbi:ABC transporter ATP-binding protein [Candidatus Falkowbacteria bacterium]|nr:ABC transporter ATP-binding protein [Candidatus Falkowbacteria bacterium]